MKNGRTILSIANMPDKILAPFGRNKYFFYGEASVAEFGAGGDELVIISPSIGRIICLKE